jgi:hypothetical protein
MVVFFNTGLTGGGHQSKSLRLVDNNEKEYVMRAVKKSGPFCKSVALKTIC